jgi:hypothetical protein
VNNSDISKLKESKTTAGVAGASGGTLLAAIASSLPNENSLKFWLLILAPSISVLVGVLWLWTQVEIANYWQDRKLKTIVKTAKRVLLEALENPNTSEEHRKLLQKKLEETELVIADIHLGRIKSMSALLTVSDIKDIESKIK